MFKIWKFFLRDYNIVHKKSEPVVKECEKHADAITILTKEIVRELKLDRYHMNFK